LLFHLLLVEQRKKLLQHQLLKPLLLLLLLLPKLQLHLLQEQHQLKHQPLSNINC
jgi:hypothetical protein